MTQTTEYGFSNNVGNSEDYGTGSQEQIDNNINDNLGFQFSENGNENEAGKVPINYM